ncbi:hypothetical protein BAU15_00780 [Enterococcus sp. JM4C]|uniref:DUF6933 domain-containing protein n=1 Tax=Candidatus Enterococcus huntleyi TaxID=1857217 RepID=UPI00137B2EBF|nr:hypothetical protein [Enterococcus sp. JM4C]KAF1299212.1 hypothetical protein BAU15_00780 [Enterococcus sp. JM4C]
MAWMLPFHQFRNLSYSPIVLADINAKNKKDLPKLIKLGIEEVFSYSNVPPVQIKKYLLKAGRIELSTNHSRSLITINNHMIQDIDYSRIDINYSTILQPDLMKFLADTIHRGLKPQYSISIEVAENELSKLL